MISQVSADLENSHEKNKTNINEEGKFGRPEPNIRMMKNSDKLNQREDQKIETNKIMRENNRDT